MKKLLKDSKLHTAFFIVSLSCGLLHAQPALAQVEISAESSNVTIAPSPPPPPDSRTKLDRRGLLLGEPMSFGLKIDFGGWLTEPKGLGGGISAMWFVGSKPLFVVEILARSFYFRDSPYNATFDTELKIGSVIPLSTRSAIVIKVGFGYIGFFPSTILSIPNSSPPTSNSSAIPVHNFLSIPIEAALLIDVSPAVDLELTPLSLRPIFELGGGQSFNTGLYVGIILHPPRVLQKSDGNDAKKDVN